MYQIISAIAKPISGGGRWKAITIGGLKLNYLFATYSKVLVTLKNPYLPNNVCLDLSTIQAEFGGLSITFSALLTQLGEDSLPTTNTLPVMNTRYARYADAFHANYEVLPIHPSAAADSQYPLSEKKWVRLSRPDTDYSLLYKSCLVVVNGYYHATDYDSNGVYVHDAMVTSWKGGENQIGLVSFRELGELTFIPITAGMIFPQADGVPLREVCYIDLGVDVGDKTVMLVMGGYLHLLDPKTFFMSSESLATVKFNNFPLLDRYYESVNKMDLSSLELETTDRNVSQISVSDLYSDRSLKAYLTLSQSFFVLLDNEDIFVDKIPLLATKMSGMYVSYVPPIYPMVNQTGRAVNYWYKKEGKQYSVTCVGAALPRRMYQTTAALGEPSVDNSSRTAGRDFNSLGYLLQIGSDI